MILYDEHAEFQLKRRRIAKEWVEETISTPDTTETKAPGNLSFAVCRVENSCYES